MIKMYKVIVIAAVVLVTSCASCFSSQAGGWTIGSKGGGLYTTLQGHTGQPHFCTPTLTYGWNLLQHIHTSFTYKL